MIYLNNKNVTKAKQMFAIVIVTCLCTETQIVVDISNTKWHILAFLQQTVIAFFASKFTHKCV